MKKLFALMLALCLLCSVAMAEEAVEMNWADVEAAAAEYNGVFFPIDLGLKVWAPADYLVYTQDQLPEDYTSKGIYALITPEDGSGAIALQYVEANGADVMDCVNAIEGASEAKAMVINGYPCVNFDMKDQDATAVAFGTEQGRLFVVMFMPMSNADFAKVATIMVASLQSAE